MPRLAASRYRAPFWLPGGHAQTMFPVLFRKVAQTLFERRRISTPDGDAIDLDILFSRPAVGEPETGNKGTVRTSEGAVILSHGLEGNSRRAYIRGMCLAFASRGWDCIARNFRNCGGGINTGPSMYHSGQTEDLHATLLHCLEAGYTRLILVGFSIGGNQTLKYLGENPERVPSEVVGAAAFSVPCDLTGCAARLGRPENAVYMRYFLRTLRRKVRLKHAQYPDLYPLEGLEGIRTFKEFDGRYTAPVHGFASAEDYWTRASCLPFLSRIRVKTLLVNARNDPFLSSGSFPSDLARASRNMTLETPDHGGHVGFTPLSGRGMYWSESRTVEFFAEQL